MREHWLREPTWALRLLPALGTVFCAVSVPKMKEKEKKGKPAPTYQASGHGGTEQEGLPARWQELKDDPQLCLEGRLQKPISLIQHQELAARKAGCQIWVTAHQVLQAGCASGHLLSVQKHQELAAEQRRLPGQGHCFLRGDGDWHAGGTGSLFLGPVQQQ